MYPQQRGIHFHGDDSQNGGLKPGDPGQSPTEAWIMGRNLRTGSRSNLELVFPEDTLNFVSSAMG